MIPDKFNMVDMGGIDIVECQGVAIEGLYDKLVESITQCRYQCLYNWKFDGIIIPPTYVEMVHTQSVVKIGKYVEVNSDDVVHIHSIEIVIPPNIESLEVVSNGTYSDDEIDGYMPVYVEVPSPPLQIKAVTTNGDVVPDSGYYGLSKVSVNVVSVLEGTTVPDDSVGLDGEYFIQYINVCRLNGQYIDTGIEANTAYGFKISFYQKTLKNSYQSILSGDTDNFTIGALNSLVNIYLWERSSSKGNKPVSDSYLNTIEKNPVTGVCTINGDSYYTSIGTLQTNATHVKLNTNVAGRQADIVFSELVLYDSSGGELCHLIVRESDIYDTVSETVYSVGTEFSNTYNATYKKISGHWTKL